MPAALLSLSITVLSIALARPVTRDVVPLRSEGFDILLVLDVSSSMNAEDMEEGSDQRRVEAVREQALAFAEEREGDRIGMITFARYADLRCPPTLDMEALAAFLRSVDTVREGSDEDGTAIGVALTTATALLEAVDAPSKIVVLLSDGEETVREIMPDEAAKLAADAGVRVHTIGLGSYGRSFFGQRVELEFPTLEEIADTTDGRFFRARSADDLAEVYAEIDQLERRVIEDPRYRTTDWFGGPLLAGIALLLLSLLAEFAWIRGLP